MGLQLRTSEHRLPYSFEASGEHHQCRGNTLNSFFVTAPPVAASTASELLTTHLALPCPHHPKKSLHLAACTTGLWVWTLLVPQLPASTTANFAAPLCALIPSPAWICQVKFEEVWATETCSGKPFETRWQQTCESQKTAQASA